LALKDALEQRDWLVGMTSRFVKRNDRLKEISLAYRNTGEWLKPTNDETGTKRSWSFGRPWCMKAVAPVESVKSVLSVKGYHRF
jgi:hypothetical protein